MFGSITGRPKSAARALAILSPSIWEVGTAVNMMHGFRTLKDGRSRVATS
jgi:hypothetical protein